MWVARDKDGELILFYNKPFRLEYDRWATTWINWMKLDSKLFPDLTWDDEPIEVELVRKNKN